MGTFNSASSFLKNGPGVIDGDNRLNGLLSGAAQGAAGDGSARFVNGEHRTGWARHISKQAEHDAGQIGPRRPLRKRGGSR